VSHGAGEAAADGTIQLWSAKTLSVRKGDKLVASAGCRLPKRGVTVLCGILRPEATASQLLLGLSAIDELPLVSVWARSRVVNAGGLRPDHGWNQERPLGRDRLAETNAVIVSTTVISSHDPRGTMRNVAAGVDLGGHRATFP
jgi:hypothetical protein